MAHGTRWSTHEERERSQFVGEVAFNVYEKLGKPSINIGFSFQDPFFPVMNPVWVLPKLPKFDKKVVGAGLMVFGTGILLPGPLDLALAGAGFALGGPWGAVGALAIYNITAVGLIVVGYLMVTG
jgi:hypothetical protein